MTVNDDVSHQPERFKLYQNYPNPFNPSTTIEFEVPSMSHVTVKIYDVLGREVITLVDRTFQPGRYSLLWHAIDDKGKHVTTGIYFYYIQANDFTEVKKAVLMR